MANLFNLPIKDCQFDTLAHRGELGKKNMNRFLKIRLDLNMPFTTFLRNHYLYLEVQNLVPLWVCVLFNDLSAKLRRHKDDTSVCFFLSYTTKVQNFHTTAAKNEQGPVIDQMRTIWETGLQMAHSWWPLGKSHVDHWLFLPLCQT